MHIETPPVTPAGFATSATALAHRLAAVRGFLLDMDGTLVLGDDDGNGFKALPGAAELLARLRARGVPYVVFTNGSAMHPRDYAAMLRQAGLDVTDAEMMTPISVATDLMARRGLRRVLALGMEGVWRPLLEIGIEAVRPPEPARDIDAVLVGWHPDFSIADLRLAYAALEQGAALYVTSMARTFATRHGKTLGISRGIVAMIRSFLPQRRAVLVGKPARLALRGAARRLGVATGRMAVVGDDPDLEMAMARAGGALAVAVETGLADAAHYAALPPACQPDLVLRDVAGLLPAFD